MISKNENKIVKIRAREKQVMSKHGTKKEAFSLSLFLRADRTCQHIFEHPSTYPKAACQVRSRPYQQNISDVYEKKLTIGWNRTASSQQMLEQPPDPLQKISGPASIILRTRTHNSLDPHQFHPPRRSMDGFLYYFYRSTSQQ